MSSDREPTAEQRAIVEFDPDPGQTVAVECFAGTGKTTTCFMIINKWVARGHHVTYVCYNRRAAQEAADRVCGDGALSETTVRAKTIHSLCFEFLTQKWGAWVEVKKGRWWPKELGFGERDWKPANAFQAWLGDPEQSLAAAAAAGASGTGRGNTHTLRLLDEFWERVKRNEAGPVTYDAMLRLFCVDFGEEAAAWLAAKSGALIFDECQDAQRVAGHFLQQLPRRQPALRLYMVGDSHQAIYAFANARDAMKRLPAGARVFHLSQSFRFGREVAHLATSLLRDARLLAADKPDVRGNPERETRVLGPTGNQDPWPVVRLARTNGALLQEALHIRVADPRARFFFVGRVDQLRRKIDKLLAINSTDRWRKHEALKRKETQEGRHALTADELDEMFLLRFLETQPVAQVRRLLDSIETVDEVGGLPARAPGQYLLSTAHSAKGLEFDQVKLLADFIDLRKALLQLDGRQRTRQLDLFGRPVRAQRGDVASMKRETIEEEVRLLYVAVTRARHWVRLPTGFWDWAGDALMEMPPAAAPPAAKKQKT